MASLLISGSPRIGNCEYILKKIKKKIKNKSELILLRNLNINYCKGCLYCENNESCLINDDMQNLYSKILKADKLIIAVPNYYDNVTGLFKTFIDRLNIFFKNQRLKDKKIIFIVVGSGSKRGNQRVLDYALNFFVRGYRLNIIKTFNIVIKNVIDLKNNKGVNEIINYF